MWTTCEVIGANGATRGEAVGWYDRMGGRLYVRGRDERDGKVFKLRINVVASPGCLSLSWCLSCCVCECKVSFTHVGC
jgi:hypothetical protein